MYSALCRNCINPQFSSFTFDSKNVINSAFIKNSNDMILSKNTINSTNNKMSSQAENTSDLWFCSCMINCHHCLMCHGLVNKEYCYMNKQYTKEEFEKILEQFRQEQDDFQGQSQDQWEIIKFIKNNKVIAYQVINLYHSDIAIYIYTNTNDGKPQVKITEPKDWDDIQISESDDKIINIAMPYFGIKSLV